MLLCLLRVSILIRISSLSAFQLYCPNWRKCLAISSCMTEWRIRKSWKFGEVKPLTHLNQYLHIIVHVCVFHFALKKSARCGLPAWLLLDSYTTLFSVCWKRNLLESPFFVSKVFLGAWKKNALKDILTVYLMVDFDDAFNKSKQCFASWTNLTPIHDAVELSPYFDNGWWTLIEFNCCGVCENLTNCLPLIMCDSLCWCYAFLNSYIFVGLRKVPALFYYFLSLVSKELFHKLLIIFASS